jgi:iron complex outermembrane receptor protein
MQMSRNGTRYIGSAIGVMAMAATFPAASQVTPVAQAPDPGAPSPQSAGIADIIVTAQKRSENLQRTPAAVTALSGDSLVQSGTADLRALQNLVPAARFQPEGASTQVILRGVGSNLDFGNVEPTVAFNVNGIYTPREGTSQPLFDLERVEVLPGPQGTLYGRNSLGGTINVTFRRPTQEFETSGALEAGNYGLVHATLVQNVPLSDDFSVRAAVDYARHDGYMESGANSKDDFGGRLGLLYNPSKDLSIYVWGNAVSRSGSPPNLVNKGTDPNTNTFSEGAYLRDRPWDDLRPGALAAAAIFGQPIAEQQKYHLWNFGGQFDIGLGGGVTLSYIPGYFSLDSHSKYWLGVIPAFKEDDYRLLTQELRLSGVTDHLNWLIGLYGYTQKTVGFFSVGNASGTPGPFGFVASNVLHHRVKGVAIFGQATYSFTDTLRFTAGGRGSFDKRTANGISLADQVTPYSYDQSFSHFDYKIGAEYDLTPKVMVYATYQTGYQPGSFNEIPATAPASNNIASPTMSSVSGGFKSRLWDNRLQINVEGFYYSYSDLLVQAYDASKAYNEIFNAKARNYGLQIDTVLKPSQNDSLNLSIAYLNAKITKYSKPGLIAFEGLSEPYAADWTINVGYHHDFHLTNGYIRPAADARYEGAYYADAVHTPGTRQAPTWTENASLTYYSGDAKWSAGIWIKNITDKAIIAATAAAGIPGPATAYLQDPRTFGGRLTFNF